MSLFNRFLVICQANNLKRSSNVHFILQPTNLHQNIWWQSHKFSQKPKNSPPTAFWTSGWGWLVAISLPVGYTIDKTCLSLHYRTNQMRLNIFVSQGAAMNVVNSCFLDLYILKGFREGVFEKCYFSMQMLTSGNLNCNKLVLSFATRLSDSTVDKYGEWKWKLIINWENN